MKLQRFLLPLFGALVLGAPAASAQGTAFTYQGRLDDGGAPAAGSYDLRFTLYDAATGGNVIGTPLTNMATALSNGLFTVALDFGSTPFTPGAPRWLELGVRTNGGGNFSSLAARQPVTAAPFAVQALNAANAAVAASAGSVAAANITGTLKVTQLPAAVVTNGASGVALNGSFTGNGGALTNIPLSGLNSFGTLGLVTNGLNFTLASAPATGVRPTAVQAVDLNGDGKPDLVVANRGASTLTVLTNNGTGGLGLNATLNVGVNPAFVLATNVSVDGRLDLLSANFGDGTLTLLTNNGAGIFSSNASFTVGTAPMWVVAGDVNNDGRLDLITANSGSASLTLLLNNGNNTFLPITLPVGNTPECVALGDLNGDGKPDLVSANTGDNTLTILTNNGGGAFGSNATLNVGAGPECVVMADLNGDGKPDLVSANYHDNTLTVLTNNGAGVFGFSATLSVGSNPQAVLAVDLNGDGKLDLLCANYGSSSVTPLLNSGGSQFMPVGSMAVGNGPTAMVAADFNGDGRMDVVTANFNDNDVTVLTNAPGQVSASLDLAGQNGGLRFSGSGGVVNVIDGAAVNQVDVGVSGAVVAGGGTTNFLGQASANRVSADYSSIGGGSGNWVEPGADHAVIGGGWNDLITAGAYESVIAGGQNNTLSNSYAVIGGGRNNVINGSDDVIGGGSYNQAGSSVDYYYGGVDGWATVGGGFYNTASGAFSVVAGGGGYYGYDGNTASGWYSAVGGGYYNRATGNDATVAGGGYNLASGGASFAVGQYSTATNDYASVPGGYYNIAGGKYSLAAGYEAQALHQGAFVWADSAGQPFSSTANDQFLVRAQGGVGLNTATPGGALSVNTGPSGTVTFRNEANLVPALVVTNVNSYSGYLRFRNALEIFPNDAGTAAGLLDVRNSASATTISLNGANGAVSATSFSGTSASLSSLTVPTVSGGTLSATNQVRLNDKPIYFRTGADANHGLAYNGGTVTNFGTGNAQIDGPVLWGYTGGELGVMNGGSHSVLTWTNNGVSVAGNVYANGVLLTSDRNAKENFTPLDPQDILTKVAALPLSEWNYKSDSAERKHLGPMAQDFHAAFGLDGGDDKHISVVDAAGVALAAIQGLNKKVETSCQQSAARLQQLEAENQQLKQRLENLEQLLRAKGN